MTIDIKKLQAPEIDRFEALITIFEEVFGMKNFLMPDRSYLENLLRNGQFMVYVALFGDQVVGGLTAYVLPSYYYQSSEVYIYDLAVDKPFQRKGTGRRLIDALRADCLALGLQELFVHADRLDQHAIDFYKATGGRPEDVIHFNYLLR